MPRPPAISVGTSVAVPIWRLRCLPTVLGLVALTTMTAGMALLIRHARLADVEHMMAPAGILLVACALAQGRIAWRAWNHPALAPAAQPHAWAFCRRLFVGVFLAYLVSAGIGPVRNIEYAFLAVAAAWYTLLLLPLTASAPVLAQWRKWTQERAARRLNWLIFASISMLILAEACLWTHKLARQHGWLARGGGRSAAGERPGEAGQRAELSSGGPLRVAVLTGGPAASPARPNGYLARIEQSLPGVEIVPIRLDGPWSSHPRSVLADRLSAARADLVLAVLPVCEDLSRDVPRPSWFDWRQFELARLVVAPTADDAASSTTATGDFETLCRELAPQLAACRTPLDDCMLHRWQRKFQALDDFVAECRAADLTVALVLVPGEFQVNRALCDTLARRAGCKTEQLDVELPQRKLAAFAEHHGLPLVDLLPSLRLCPESPYQRNAATWNEAGHAAAAAAIGGWLESRYGRSRAVAAQLTVAP